MKVRELALSAALVALLAPMAPGDVTEAPIGSSIQLASIDGTGAPQHRLDCDGADDMSIARCKPDDGESPEAGATDRGG